MIKLKGLVDEDICNYKKCSLFLIFPYCSFKCDKEYGTQICQNSILANHPITEISVDKICERYVNNPLTSAIVCGGLEPFDSHFDLISLIDCLRNKYHNEDEVVIYTGYLEEELEDSNNSLHIAFENLKKYSNIIIKFGRFIPNQQEHFDEVLGIKLASNNQYAKKIS